MKAKIFKTVLLGALLAMLILMLGACATEEAEPPAVAATPAPAAPVTPVTPGEAPAPVGDIPAFMNPVGEFPLVNEPITFSVFVGAMPGQDMVTNLAANWIAERTGVSVDWIQAPMADRDTQLNLMLATGDVPDIIFGGAGTHATVFFYSQLGVFRPITNYIDTFAPNLQAMFEALPFIRDDMIMPDGHIYGFPAIDDAFHGTMSQKLWIYTPWL
jgi:putative aldouronate transport system substrate-binding protein